LNGHKISGRSKPALLYQYVGLKNKVVLLFFAPRHFSNHQKNPSFGQSFAKYC